MRGRLIFPFLAEIVHLDAVATAADPDGAGPLTSGYDDIFREPVKLPDASGEGAGTTVREETTAVRIPAQIEPIMFDRLNMFFSGNVPNVELQLIFHFKWLERNSLVDSNGEPFIRVSDRLVAIYTMQEDLVQIMRPFLYVTEVRPLGFGLDMGRSKRNLLFVTFEDREKGVPAS